MELFCAAVFGQGMVDCAVVEVNNCDKVDELTGEELSNVTVVKGDELDCGKFEVVDAKGEESVRGEMNGLIKVVGVLVDSDV
jgi:non-homologous end joining protein Ku